MNKKLLTKTLIASALVLTTVGSGFHSSSNYNGINNVAKASEIKDNQLWKKVRDSLKDANIIDKTDNETIEVKYKTKNGAEGNISGTASLNELGSSNNAEIDSYGVSRIDIKRVNPKSNSTDANSIWKKLVDSLKDKELVKEGAKVSIYSKDKEDGVISGNVGDTNSNAQSRIINTKDITHITIENN
ncbi:TPA: DUF4888 domain-containing protein [Staphylococcus aureus]|uniref:DUF4888 domain-containing protein n=1 Tax=Staphylococcus aureus TaxID=1280 RepID=UPI0007CA4798|nr:DUF4888 domain-containing protein [Staphylococcus aureus]MBO1276317.1 DUF4888 domain-containing protein [Staphylococcus aureus]MCR0708784.1 DUF4888 domain-containing protein [Staphylococcus aureus]MCR0716144.1 DUF4888 domain-containing protein [Staphylococcus aureus]MCR0735805.1 DUF4888 domain-containing protein [Staphylococcus aureus]MCS5293943.1 DUF4888 domain-containing protein [Staphylococcus aureus]